MRVSCVMSCPSEVTEIQEFPLARTISFSVAAGLSAGFLAVAPKERMVTTPFFSTLTAFGSSLVSAVRTGAGACLAGGGFSDEAPFDSVEGCADGVAVGAGVADAVGICAAEDDEGCVLCTGAAAAVVDGAEAGEPLDAPAVRLLRECRVHKKNTASRRHVAAAIRIQEIPDEERPRYS